MKKYDTCDVVTKTVWHDYLRAFIVSPESRFRTRHLGDWCIRRRGWLNNLWAIEFQSQVPGSRHVWLREFHDEMDMVAPDRIWTGPADKNQVHRILRKMVYEDMTYVEGHGPNSSMFRTSVTYREPH